MHDFALTEESDAPKGHLQMYVSVVTVWLETNMYVKTQRGCRPPKPCNPVIRVKVATHCTGLVTSGKIGLERGHKLECLRVRCTRSVDAT